MIRQILVPLMLGRAEADAARYACALAEPFAAAVDVVVGMSAVSPIVAGWDYYPAGVFDTLDEATRAASEALAGEVHRALADTGDQASVRVSGAFWMTPGEQALQHAQTADLVVLARPAAPTDADRALFASLLLGAGRPILVTPPDALRKPPRRIAVAWNGTREAVRALHDALPLLRAADHVEALHVVGGEAQAAIDGALLPHLDRHRVHAVLETLPRHDRAVADALMAHALDTRADLLVAGGYGHARVMEQVFGGTTHALFHHSPVPVLFSH